MQNKKFITIGSPDSRRVQFWQKALQQYSCDHQIVTYQEIIDNEFTLFEIKEPTTIRLTSAGEDFELIKILMGMGSDTDAQLLSFEKGLIYPNDFWFKGWSILMEMLNFYEERNAFLKFMNTPFTVLIAFHKLICQEYLGLNNISIPKIILKRVEDYDSLIEKMESENIHQVFIKPYHGSSALGVMALRQSKGRQMLYTTIDLQGEKLFNNLKLQKYNSIAKIRTIVNKMIPSGLMVEEWIRKKTFREKSVDFRILVINGKAAFVVPRMSNHFITNLHLGNEKGNIKEVEEAWGKELIDDAKILAVQAVEVMSDLFYAGVDVAISEKGKPYVLEINAFGDMLLDIFQDGMSPYEYELKEWMTDI